MASQEMVNTDVASCGIHIVDYRISWDFPIILEIELEEEQKYNHYLFGMKTNNNFMEMSNCWIAQMVETLID